MKTNAVRELDRLNIPYELREYVVDPEDLTADTVAAKIGMPASQVFKTLVAEGDRGGVLLAVVPGDAELDLKALARLSDNRRTALVPVKDVQALTGYVRGGVTALALKRPYPVYADASIEVFDRISVSAGTRGLQIVLAPADYLKAVSATLGDIAARR